MPNQVPWLLMIHCLCGCNHREQIGQLFVECLRCYSYLFWCGGTRLRMRIRLLGEQDPHRLFPWRFRCTRTTRDVPGHNSKWQIGLKCTERRNFDDSTTIELGSFKPGFHIVVSVVSVVSVLSKKFLRQIQPYGNLTHNRPRRQIQRVVRDRNDSISYIRYNRKWTWHDSILLMETTASYWHDRYNKNVSQNALRSAAVTAAEATDTTDTTIWKPSFKPS